MRASQNHMIPTVTHAGTSLQHELWSHLGSQHYYKGSHSLHVSFSHTVETQCPTLQLKGGKIYFGL